MVSHVIIENTKRIQCNLSMLTPVGCIFLMLFDKIKMFLLYKIHKINVI